ncbi:MAG: LicD family protein [Balneolaceae bacterium]|nr:LicD family protein [Balneolaceae bacterium]
MLEQLQFRLRRSGQFARRLIHTRGNQQQIRKNILWDLFDICNRFLRSLDADYWVNYGTLLGFYRKQDLIPHDIDIDFGCRKCHYREILQNADRLGPDVTLHDTSARHYGPKLYLNYKGFDADIYFYDHTGGQLISYENTEWPNYRAPIPEEYVFPTRRYEIKGYYTRVPADTEQYLRTIYGNLSEHAKRNEDTGYWE